MQSLQSNLAAILLVVHGMIGCCHYHPQGDEQCATAELTLCAAPCACCGSGDKGEQRLPPCDGEQHCHGVCTYLPTQKTTISPSNAGNGFDLAPAIPAQLDGQLAAMPISWDGTQGISTSPPLRLHLRHQILQI